MKLVKNLMLLAFLQLLAMSIQAQCVTTYSTDFQSHCDSYTWINGVTYTSNNSTATDTITKPDGCDSVISLALVIRQTSMTNDVQVACESFTWTDGQTYTSSNSVAKDTFSNFLGCDSIVTLNLTINNPTFFTDVQIACDSFTWINGTKYFANNNTDKDTLSNIFGCDSIITLDLTITNANAYTDVVIACDSFTWINNVTYFSSNNTAKDTIPNNAGCDSIISLDLTINSPSFATFTVAACDSFTWTNGVKYFTNNNTDTDTIPNASGCDSVITLDLTITNATFSTDTHVACDSFTWINGTTYYANNNTATDTVPNSTGCDSIITLNLTINNATFSNDVRTRCNEFTWTNGVTYTQNNFVAKDTFMNVAGCDSIVTLNLTLTKSYSTDTRTACDSFTWRNGITYYASNNSATDTILNSTGCDSIITLDLTINNSVFTTDIQVACDSFTWINGITYYANNTTAKDTLPNAAGCDSIITLDLTINLPTTHTIADTACDTYTGANGSIWTTSGSYNDTIPNAAGCDSVITYDLIIKNSTSATIADTACVSYTGANGTVWTASGSYNDTINNAVGCDSIITYNLIINNPSTYTDVKVSCDSFTWINNVTYYATNNTATDTLVNAVGCDSIITLDLTINNAVASTDVKVVCDSLTWIDGNTYYNDTTTATHTLATAAGCDSVVTLDLTIIKATYSTDVHVSCDSFTWMNGVTYYASNNVAQDTIPNAVGCDSIITLDLTITTSTFATQPYTRCNEFTWINGVTYYTNNNTAKDTIPNSAGCDSIITLNLTLTKSYATDVRTACDSFTWRNGVTYYANNITAKDTILNSTGCDSIITLNLTINSAKFTNDVQISCDSFTWINGMTYYTSNNTAKDTLNANNGCDSIITLNLTINNSVFTTDVQVACDSFTWTNGITYYANNNMATDTFQTVLGCDSIVTLNLTVNNATYFTDYQTACDSFTWINGVTYTSSSIMGRDTLINSVGCDSVVSLVIIIRHTTYSTDVRVGCNEFTWTNGVTYTQNNTVATDTFLNAAGCDSIVTLNLTLSKSFTTDIQIACDSFTWIDGNTYYADNSTATDTLTNVSGCDSIITLNLTMNNAIYFTQIEMACDSFTWIDGNTYYSSNSTAIDTLQTVKGCDSIVTLNLTINSSSFNTITTTACDSYTGASGSTWNMSGVYFDTITNNSGCDSITTYNLTINNTTVHTITDTTCDSYTGTNGTTWTMSGTYTETITNSTGCDSVITYILVIKNSTTSTDVQVACDSYTWINGVTYTASNNSAQHVITNAAGCDSTITLNLTINPTTFSTDVHVACGSFTWIDGITYTSSNNIAQQTLTNSNGCDSIVTLSLTINPTTTTNRTIYSCFSYTVPETGNVYTTSGVYSDSVANGSGCFDYFITTLTINTVTAGTITTNGGVLTIPATGDFYRWLDCDNNFAPVSTNDTTRTFRPTANGNYACMVFTNEGCIDTSACFTVNNVSLSETITTNDVVLFPNPTNNVLNIQLSGYTKNINLVVIDALGKVVYSENSVKADNINEIDVRHLNAGVYYVSIQNSSINLTKKFIVTK